MSPTSVKSPRATRPVARGAPRSHALLVCLAYYGGAQLGFGLKVASIPTSIFWLPNATMFAVFLLAPTARWWIYALAVLPAHLAIQIPHHVPPATVALLYLSNLTDGALAAFACVASRAGGLRSRACGGRRVPAFAVAAPLVVSFADAAAVTLDGWAHDFRLIWHTRFRSNVLTNLIWVPAVVIGATRGAAWLKAARRRRYLEAGLLALALVVVGRSPCSVRSPPAPSRCCCSCRFRCFCGPPSASEPAGSVRRCSDSPSW